MIDVNAMYSRMDDDNCDRLIRALGRSIEDAEKEKRRRKVENGAGEKDREEIKQLKGD